MKRRRNIAIKKIHDHWDDRWSVFEIRPTDHGFQVFMGRPLQEGRPLNRVGGNRVILTTPLVEYLESIRNERGTWDLPISRTTLKRLRRLLGFNLYDDLREWWEQHADELAETTETEFAARHGYSVATVSMANTALFGRRTREPGWWRQEPAATLLRGFEPRAYVAEQLGLSVGAVGRLRWRLRTEGSVIDQDD
jgi:hypothetical protein